MADSPYPSQQQDKFVLRLPDGMRDRIKAAAEENNRSMNAEIVARLEASLNGEAEGGLSAGMVELRYRLAPDGPQRAGELDALRELAATLNSILESKRSSDD